MAGPWIVDGNRFASKIRNASTGFENIQWKSNPTKACPNCHYVIDNSDVAKEWPGLPKGVKFDPADPEIIWHLLAKVGSDGFQPHPFINEFIPTVDKDDGICYTHPQKLPGVKQDGSVSHFFHRAIKAYNSGTRKRRKILGDDLGDVRWHKTGRTKPVILDGVQTGCKKIMVLYTSSAKGGKTEKTNWVMHQYHLGTEEDERDGEYVISKIFYQQQQTNKLDKHEEDLPVISDALVPKVDPNTPMSVTPEPPRFERQYPDFDLGRDSTLVLKVDPNTPISISPEPLHSEWQFPDFDQGIDSTFVPKVGPNTPMSVTPEPPRAERQVLDFDQGIDSSAAFEYLCLQIPKVRDLQDKVQLQRESLSGNDKPKEECGAVDMTDDYNNAVGDLKWWDSDSQPLLDSQQLADGAHLCDEFLQSQSPSRNPNGNQVANSKKPSLSDYTQLGPECLKKDLEDCQNPAVDNIELDTPPDFRLSQLEFGSQDSYLTWAKGLTVD